MPKLDILSMNKAALAHKRMREAKIDERVVVFVIPTPRVGATRQEIRFPYGGEIIEVYVSCSEPGEQRTVLRVEKCSQSDFDSTPQWVNATGSVVLDPNERSTETTSNPLIITEPTVNPSDHLRINFLEVGTGVQGITIEVVIKL